MTATIPRRAFIAGLGAVAVAVCTWPLLIWAEQPALPLIGYLAVASPKLWESRPGGFRQGLHDTGHADALLVLGTGLFISQRRHIASLVARNRLPAIYSQSEYVHDGGLVAYGPDPPDLFRRAAAYVDKIFKGAKPADPPVEQPTKFELAINLKTAKALRLTIPQSVLFRADEVIQ